MASDARRTLERIAHRVPVPEPAYERLLLRRDRKARNRRISARVLGVVLALISIAALLRAFGGTRQPADPLPSPTLRHGEEVIEFEPLGTGQGRDLVAVDPETGAVRKIVETDGIIRCPNPCKSFPKAAAWSSDGQWVAFEVSFASLDRSPHGPCGPEAGIWVKDATGDPRQLTTPCDASTPPPTERRDYHIEELWEWSPSGAQLAYARIDGHGDVLSLLDPADGRLTPLAEANDDFRTIEWSPDGTRIAFADGGSVYAVGTGGGPPTMLADSFQNVVNMEWSPDGERILVVQRDRRLLVMDADGSNIHELAGTRGYDCCQPSWSPDGSRIAYMVAVDARSQAVWTVSPNGSDPIEILDCCASNGNDVMIWSPDGTEVAYETDPTPGWRVINADGTGTPRPIEESLVKSWIGGSFSGGELGGQWEL